MTNDTIADDAAMDSAKLKFLQAGLAAVPRTVESKLRESISIVDFGAIPDGGASAATANTAALNAAIAFALSLGGAKIRIPAGEFMFNETITLDAPPGGSHNIVIEGEFSYATFLDFSLCAAGSNGINIVGPGGRCGFRGFTVRDAPGIGIDWNHGTEPGSLEAYQSEIFSEDLQVVGCGSHGIKWVNTYIGRFHDIVCLNNDGNGLHLGGFHTSMSFERCWPSGDGTRGNGGYGWFINGCVYCHWDTCAADWSALDGWSISNVAGVVLTACGSEQNKRSGWNITTERLPNFNGTTRGLILEGCLASNNSKEGVNTFANFLGMSTGNGTGIDVELRGCVDLNSEGTTISRVLNGASGAIRITESGSSMMGSDRVSGSVDIQNDSVAGRSALVTISGAVSIPTDTLTTIPFNAVISNRLGATVPGSGPVVIPAGVHRVRVIAGVYWDSNSSGYRFIQLMKNGAFAYGLPQVKALPSGITPHNAPSAIIEVTAGDQISVAVSQSSGGSLNVTNNTATWLSVEAIG